MRATILYDEHGEIIAISKIGNLNDVGSKFTQVGMVPGQGQQLIEVDLGGEAEKKSLLQLHKEYCIDIAKLELTKRK